MTYKKSQLLLTPLFALIGRSGGLIIPFIIAHFYGAGKTTDAFFFSFGIAFFIYGVTQQIFESMLLPYIAERKRKDLFAGAAFVSKVTVWFVPLLTLLSIGIWAGLPPVLKASSGLDAGTVSLTASLFLQMVPFLVLGVMASGLNGLFNASKVFWFPAFSPFLRSAVVIACVVIFHNLLGIYALPGGFAAGEFLRWALSLLLLYRLRLWKLGGKPSSAPAVGKDVTREIVFQVIALAGIQLIPLVNQWFATWMDHGELSLFNYADRLFTIPYQIFLAGMSQVLLSHWAEHFGKDSIGVFRLQVSKEVRAALIITAAISLALWVFRMPLSRLFYGHGTLSAAEIELIGEVFGWNVLGLAPAILQSLYLRLLYVMKKSSFFCIHSWMKLFLQAALNVLFASLWGIKGIAAAGALVHLAGLAVLYAYINKQWKSPVEKD